ncbi:MAG: Uma2 family endonuclease [Crocosphaera sp.]|nr:Uma2 family endonuclease [Crocosphaera sp.]
MVLTAKQFADLMPDGTLLESDEPEMESSLHYVQLALLVSCLEWFWRERNDFFIGANLTIYFSRQQLKNRDFRGPDFFLVKNTQKRPRKSWVVWEEEGKYPDLIIELLSQSTANIDKTLKKDLYQNYFRTQEYYWFSPEDLSLAGFRLVQGYYEEIMPNPSGLYWSETLELYLGIHQGKLRYFTPEEELILTPEETALQAQERAEKLANKLRELGINPDNF